MQYYIGLYVTLCNYHHFTQTNTFQSVIASDGSNTFIIFLYADKGITWTTGDANGGNDGLAGPNGTPAQVGFDAGASNHSHSVKGSFTDDIINVDEDSNVGIPGLFVFQVNQPEIKSKIEIHVTLLHLKSIRTY